MKTPAKRKSSPCKRGHKTERAASGHCKDCLRITAGEWYVMNKEKVKESSRRWHQENPKKARDKTRTWNQRNPEKLRAGLLRRQYGLTLEDYDALAAAQGRVCAICRKPELSSRRLHVDHDHTTRKVRGLLCGNCNRMLGLAKDKPEILRAAIEYLLRRQ